MQGADFLQGKWRKAVFFLTALLVIAADQFSKIGIRSHLAPGKSLPETGLLRLTRVDNTGAAFGLFQEQSLLLTIFGFIGIILLLLLALPFSRRLPFLNNRQGKLALSLIFGGTVGNLVDRLNLGYVTDFIDIGIWPTFNIADSAIVIGVIIFSYSLRSLARAKNH